MYSFKKMDNLSALQILNWHYSEPYDFYDLRTDNDELKHWENCINKNNWVNTYCAFDNMNNLIGYFNFNIEDKDLLLNTRMCPSFTNRKLSENYINEILEYVKNISEIEISAISINIAVFNKKALNILQKIGFKEDKHVPQSINGILYDFIKLSKEIG